MKLEVENAAGDTIASIDAEQGGFNTLKVGNLIFVEETTNIIPGYGVFSKGDTTEYNETLLSTGLFEVVKEEEKTKGAK